MHGMSLVRNEAGENRWLKQFLTQMKILCDRLVILDDASTDNTVEICKNYELESYELENYEFEVYQNEKCLWETNEVEARKKLWEYTIKKANIGDWILCLDADELFVSEHIWYILHKFRHINKYPCNFIGFELFDMWSDTHYREDNYWDAHLRNWAMAMKLELKEYKWSDKKLHCGRFPYHASNRILPTQIPIKHMGWSKEEFRIKKHDRYMEIDPKGKNGILEQYKSILDKNPNLVEF